MKTSYMNQSEIYMASYNLKQIEKELGHPVPPGCLDASTFCKKPLTLGEAFQIASNIKRLEKQMGRRSNTPTFKSSRTKEKSDAEGCAVLLFMLFAAVFYVYEKYIEPLFR